MIVVSDTSSLSNLLIIGRLDLLKRIFGRVIVPTAVETELYAVDRNRREFLKQDWIEVVRISNERLFRELRENLDIGEAEAITLSLELAADFLLIDDLAARNEARARGVRIIGVAGILVEAKRRGLIESVKPEIEKLVGIARFRMSSNLISEVLESVGED